MKTYEPKTTANDREELVMHVRRRGSDAGEQRCVAILADLTSCESCLAEAEREVERMKSLMQQVRREIHEQGHVSSGSWASMLHVEGLLNSEGRAGT